MSSGDYESFEDRFSDQIRKKALEMFEVEPEAKTEDFDYVELFRRILEEKDWTDKLESVIVKIRNRVRLRSSDTKLSGELRVFIPDMKEVAKAYDEMTNGYKAFIQTVLDAKQSARRHTIREADPGKSARTGAESPP